MSVMSIDRPMATRSTRVNLGTRGSRSTRQPSTERQRASAPPALRLTARGRLVAFLASLLALAALVVGAGQMVEATAGTGNGEPVAVVVGGGDTLWGIAQDIAPDQDPRSVVGQIRSLNDLGTRPIVPGQSILVPVAG
jgi:LysM domain.